MTPPQRRRVVSTETPRSPPRRPSPRRSRKRVALRAGQAEALTDAAFPADRPVVTVRNAGRVSQTAAEMLAERGFDARSLAGGILELNEAGDLPTGDGGVGGRVDVTRCTNADSDSSQGESHVAASVVDRQSPVHRTRSVRWHVPATPSPGPEARAGGRAR
jgi:rhodanese-related sulfurtransferase